MTKKIAALTHQMRINEVLGRGLRISPETGKTDCLVLDYGGNVERHGRNCLVIPSNVRDYQGLQPC